MGSFTSMPKVIPAADSHDTDLTYPVGREDLETFLDRCAKQLGSLPPPIERNFRKVNNDTNIVCSEEKIRVLQWNVLSQGKQHSSYDFPKKRTPNFLIAFLYKKEKQTAGIIGTE